MTVKYDDRSYDIVKSSEVGLDDDGWAVVRHIIRPMSAATRECLLCDRAYFCLMHALYMCLCELPYPRRHSSATHVQEASRPVPMSTG